MNKIILTIFKNIFKYFHDICLDYFLNKYNPQLSKENK